MTFNFLDGVMPITIKPSNAADALYMPSANRPDPILVNAAGEGERRSLEASP